MSFDVYQRKSIAQKLKSHSLAFQASDTPNIVYQTTIGLNELHSNIQLNEQLPALAVNPRSSTTPEGFFEAKPHTTLQKRYKVLELLGQGLCSTVYKAEDTLSKRVLALKAIRIHYELLGRREKIIVDHLKASDIRGTEQPFIHSYGWFQAKGHEFILLPCYSHSLLELIGLDKNENALASASSLFIHEPQKPSNAPLLVQPKPIHGRAAPKLEPFRTPVVNLQNENAGSGTSGQNEALQFTEADLLNLKKVAYQLLTGIWILHKEGIIHTDLKPENCFISNPTSNSSSSAAASAQTSESNHSPYTYLRQLPPDFQLKLADFSNSIHNSEISTYFDDFSLQSPPYRSPEILIGIPFTSAVDIWSVGIILLELCLGRTFITTDERIEIIQFLESKIGKFSKLRFSGGKYSHLLFETSSSKSSSAYFASSASSSPGGGSGSLHHSSKLEAHGLTNYRIDNMKAIKRLLLSSSKQQSSSSSAASSSFTSSSSGVMTMQFDKLSNYHLHELIDFLSGLLMIDPTQRLSAKDALQHSFLSSMFTIPSQLILPCNQFNENEMMKKKRNRGSTNPAGSSVVPIQQHHHVKFLSLQQRILSPHLLMGTTNSTPMKSVLGSGNHNSYVSAVKEEVVNNNKATPGMKRKFQAVDLSNEAK